MIAPGCGTFFKDFKDTKDFKVFKGLTGCGFVTRSD